MTDLKPCPFCGTNNAELRHNKDGFSFVICVKDGCYCRTDGYLNEKAAVEAWNRRAETVKDHQVDVVEVRHGEWIYGEFDVPHCSECGKEVLPNQISNYCPDCGAKMDGEVGADNA